MLVGWPTVGRALALVNATATCWHAARSCSSSRPRVGASGNQRIRNCSSARSQPPRSDQKIGGAVDDEGGCGACTARRTTTLATQSRTAATCCRPPIPRHSVALARRKRRLVRVPIQVPRHTNVFDGLCGSCTRYARSAASLKSIDIKSQSWVTGVTVSRSHRGRKASVANSGDLLDHFLRASRVARPEDRQCAHPRPAP